MVRTTINLCFVVVSFFQFYSVVAITIPLEEPISNLTIETNSTSRNLTVFVYSSEDIKIYESNDSTTLINSPKTNSTLGLGSFKWKGINRLLYLNETNYIGNITFIVNFRDGVNESYLDNMESVYGINISSTFYKSTIGGGVAFHPLDSGLMNSMEQELKNYSRDYHNISNFVLVENYWGIVASGNLISLMNLLYHNNTFVIDPGPYDLIDKYPNATFLPSKFLYYPYTYYTSCNGTLRTASTDPDGDLFLVCEGDCNNNDASVHPGAAEVCTNLVDDDCDGLIDEDCPRPQACERYEGARQA